MSYSLNSLQGAYMGEFFSGTLIGLTKGDTRSLDYSSYIYIYTHVCIPHHYSDDIVLFLISPALKRPWIASESKDIDFGNH